MQRDRSIDSRRRRLDQLAQLVGMLSSAAAAHSANFVHADLACYCGWVTSARCRPKRNDNSRCWLECCVARNTTQTARSHYRQRRVERHRIDQSNDLGWVGLIGQVHPGTWRDAFWSSQPDKQTSRALAGLVADGSPVSLAVSGGSPSAFRHNYAYYFAKLLATNVSQNAECFEDHAKPGNWKCGTRGQSSAPGAFSAPGALLVEVTTGAHGHTGTDWGALLMDSTIPRGSQILFWEFSCNDWSGHGSDEKWNDRSLELFIRRAQALNPGVLIIFIFLWQPDARACWPYCPDSSDGRQDRRKRPKWLWRQHTRGVLQKLSGSIDAFAIDVNAMATQAFEQAKATWPNRSRTFLDQQVARLFADKHHPDEATHFAIANALMAVVKPYLAQADAASRTPAPLPLPAALPTHTLARTPVFSFAAPNGARHRTHAERLVWAMLHHPDWIRSMTHNHPRLEGSRPAPFVLASMRSPTGVLDTHLKVGVPIKRAALRSDTTSFAWFPSCDSGWSYRLGLPSSLHNVHYLGLCLAGRYKASKKVSTTCIEQFDWDQLRVEVCIHKTVAAVEQHRSAGHEACLLRRELSPSDIVNVASYVDANVLSRGVQTPMHWFALPKAVASPLNRTALRGDLHRISVDICKRSVPAGMQMLTREGDMVDQLASRESRRASGRAQATVPARGGPRFLYMPNGPNTDYKYEADTIGIYSVVSVSSI